MQEAKILERVRKMLALANNEAATEGERDNALRMAHNLLTKYQLDMSDVDRHARDSEDPRGHFEEQGPNMLWARQIRSAVAKLFMCKYYYRTLNATRAEHHFIGRESNATTCMYLSNWIVRTTLREITKAYGHPLVPKSRSFATGVAYRLWDRVEEILKTKQAEIVSQGYALVLADQAKAEANENDLFLASMGTELAKARNSKARNVDRDAYNAGKSFANGIGLNGQIEKPAETLKLS